MNLPCAVLLMDLYSESHSLRYTILQHMRYTSTACISAWALLGLWF